MLVVGGGVLVDLERVVAQPGADSRDVGPTEFHEEKRKSVSLIEDDGDYQN